MRAERQRKNNNNYLWLFNANNYSSFSFFFIVVYMLWPSSFVVDVVRTTGNNQIKIDWILSDVVVDDCTSFRISVLWNDETADSKACVEGKCMEPKRNLIANWFAENETKHFFPFNWTKNIDWICDFFRFCSRLFCADWKFNDKIKKNSTVISFLKNLYDICGSRRRRISNYCIGFRRKNYAYVPRARRESDEINSNKNQNHTQ